MGVFFGWVCWSVVVNGSGFVWGVLVAVEGVRVNGKVGGGGGGEV